LMVNDPTTSPPLYLEEAKSTGSLTGSERVEQNFAIRIRFRPRGLCSTP
jgi:hypothetical protein